MGVFNCYEDTLPSFGRELFAATQPNLLVNVTNDAWFVGSQEPWLHQRLAAMRSIELRRDMVRAVNLGVSSWIDAGGRMRRSRHDAEPGFLLVAPALRNEPPTPYARFGDWPVIALLSLSIGGLWWRQRKIS
jgi:apolipoprotein N-acyltransferase